MEVGFKHPFLSSLFTPTLYYTGALLTYSEINQDSTRAHELKTESKARELVYHSLFLKNMKNESVLVGFVCQSDTSWSHHKEPPLRKSLYETQL